jgi:hypothetical protein
MFPTDVIGQERIAVRLRESERERLARRSAEARAFVRRAKARAALNLVVGTFVQAASGLSVPPNHPVRPALLPQGERISRGTADASEGTRR